MRRHPRRLALLLLALGLLVGAPAWTPVPPSACPTGRHDLVQPFIMTFERNRLVIAFLADHPDYEAIEVMITERAGRPPLLRAIITWHDGLQIDHVNDIEVARDRAAVIRDRGTAYRFIQFDESEVDGNPAARMRFTSYRGEDIDMYIEAAAPPMPTGFLVDPLGHGADSGLPIMWDGASAMANDNSSVVIDGVRFALVSPAPGVPGGIYSADFRIGVLYDGHHKLDLLRRPRRLATGERWVYRDQVGDRHIYEIVAALGDELTIRKTTSSPAWMEEIIGAEVVGDRIELRSVRVTDRSGGEDRLPPPDPAGLILDLSTPGRFSISLDEHADLVMGTASREEHGDTTSYTLQPVEPDWATSTPVTATVTRRRGVYLVDNEVGER